MIMMGRREDSAYLLEQHDILRMICKMLYIICSLSPVSFYTMTAESRQYDAVEVAEVHITCTARADGPPSAEVNGIGNSEGGWGG